MFQPALAAVNHDPWKMEPQAIALLLEMTEINITGKPADIFIEEEFLLKKSLL
jgi:hypothetical protein